jgi:hypothetical protein
MIAEFGEPGVQNPAILDLICRRGERAVVKVEGLRRVCEGALW